MTTNEFFELAYDRKLSLSEINNFIKQHVDLSNMSSVKWFLLDFDTYFYQKRIEALESLSDDVIISKVKEFQKEQAHLPDLRLRLSSKIYFVDHYSSEQAVSDEVNLSMKITNRLFSDINTDCLDFEQIVLKDKFEGIYTLQVVLNEILNRDLKKLKNFEKTGTTQPIHWIKGEESLRLFIEELKNASLIEKRKTEDIIQEHFFVDGQAPTKEPKPIAWKVTKVLLAHLINGLEKSVENKNIWKDLAPHFEWKGKTPDGLRQSYNDNPHPNNIEKIESIIKQLNDSE